MVNCNICGWHLFLCRYPKLVVIAWSDYRPRETERPRDLCVPCDQRAVVVFNSIVFVVIVRGRRWFKKKCHSRKYTYNWRRKKKLLTRKQAKTIYDGPDSDDEYRSNNGQPGCRCGGERRRSSSRKWWVIDAKCSYTKSLIRRKCKDVKILLLLSKLLFSADYDRNFNINIQIGKKLFWFRDFWGVYKYLLPIR